jgi:hypothetical protein
MVHRDLSGQKSGLVLARFLGGSAGDGEQAQGIGYGDPVSSGSFRLIQGRIRSLEQPLQSPAMVGKECDPDGERDVSKRALFVLQPKLLHSFPDLLGSLDQNL